MSSERRKMPLTANSLPHPFLKWIRFPIPTKQGGKSRFSAEMSVRGVLVNNDSVDSLVEYQELAAQSAAKAPKSPLTYGHRVDYFDRAHKGKRKQNSND